MNQKNSLGLNNCFLDLEDPIHLFKVWMDEAKKSEPNDPNALALATSNKNNLPSVRMVLLTNFNENGFVFFTNLLVYCPACLFYFIVLCYSFCFFIFCLVIASSILNLKNTLSVSPYMHSAFTITSFLSARVISLFE